MNYVYNYQDMALQTAGLLSGNLADILTTKPFPVEDLENVHFGTSGNYL